MIRDPQRRAQLDQVGCSELGRLNAQVTAEALTAVSALLPPDREDLHYSSASSDAGYRRAVSDALVSTIAPAVASLLGPEATALFGVVIAQRAAAAGMGFHHDLSFTEPEPGRAIVAWVALTDVNTTHGTLSFLPGSHRLVTGPRGTPSFPSPLRDLPAELLEGHFRVIDAPAGTVVAADPRIAHRSTANRSNTDRLTAVVVFIPRGAQLVHHYLRPDGLVERFAADQAFYTRFDLQDRPAGLRSLGTFVPTFPAVDRDMFESVVIAAGAGA